MTIRGNIVRHNSSFGLHLYSSIKNSVIAGDLVHGQARGRGIIVACPDGRGKNVIANNTVVEKKCIAIWNGNGEIVVTNILAADSEVFSFNENTENASVGYNLCVPRSELQGPHGITGDPKFVEAGRGVSWLRPGGLAIEKGAPQYAPPADFWGRPHPKGKPMNLGAFALAPSLTNEETRANWCHDWAYRYAPTEGREMPDLWGSPSNVR